MDGTTIPMDGNQKTTGQVMAQQLALTDGVTGYAPQYQPAPQAVYGQQPQLQLTSFAWPGPANPLQRYALLLSPATKTKAEVRKEKR